jgi:hypothetical protein
VSVCSRVLVGLAAAALVTLGAAGLSGFLTFPEHCLQAHALEASRSSEVREGTIVSSRTRVWPPGAECTYVAPTRTDVDGRFIYRDASTEVRREGSTAVFFAVLAIGVLIAILVIHAWPRVPRALRLTATTGLAFAAFGAGAVVGGVALGLMAGWGIGLPLAYAADRWLGRHERGITAGLTGAAVAFIAVPAAVVLLMLDGGLGVGAFAVVIVAVALLSAVPWRRAPSAVAGGPPTSLRL